MTYLVHEVFLTLQGEGYWAGRPAVFCRFARCNLWTGQEKDRASAICTFCDTDFVEGTEYECDALLDAIEAAWPVPHHECHPRFVVLTGGEPTLQVDDALVRGLHERGFYIAIETNGTLPLPDGIDWVCVSPKTPGLRVRFGDELKLVYPQDKISPEHYEHLGFTHLWLSPMDVSHLDTAGNSQENTDAAVAYCLTHPKWRLSIQTHKVIGIP